MESWIFRTFWTSFLFLAFSGSAFPVNQHIEITAYRANIRTAAATSASLVVTAQRGDIFELLGESPNWYQIRLFSGEVRHIHQSLAKVVVYSPEVPENSALRHQIFQALKEAEERVVQEADRRYPPETRLRGNLQFQTQLRDKYKLEVMHRLKVQTPVYRRISIEGARSGW